MDMRNSETGSDAAMDNAAAAGGLAGQTGWGDTVDRKRFLVGVHLNGRQLAALERYRASLDDEVSRPQAIRSILTCWLKQNGHL